MGDTGLVEYFAQQLLNASKEEPLLIAIASDGVNSSRLQAFKEAYPERLIQVGISEQDAVGTAVGMAFEGFVPFVFGYSAYLLPRAFEQVRNHVGVNRIPIVLVGTHAGMTGYNAGDRSFEDLALARCIDTMKILSPADFVDIERCIEMILDSRSAYYVRLANIQLSLQPDGVGQLDDRNSTLHLRKPGTKRCVVSHGRMLREVMAALADTPVAVFSCLELGRGIDRESLERLADFDVIFVVEDHKEHGSLYQEMALAIRQLDRCVDVRFVGVPDSVLAVGPQGALLVNLGLDPATLRHLIYRP